MTLDDYLINGYLTGDEYETILSHIRNGSNIIVGGGTGSGKTTFINVLLAEMTATEQNPKTYIIDSCYQVGTDYGECVFINPQGDSYKYEKSCCRTVRKLPVSKNIHIVCDDARYNRLTQTVLESWKHGHGGGIIGLNALCIDEMIERIYDMANATERDLPGQFGQLYILLKSCSGHPVVCECKAFSRNEHFFSMRNMTSSSGDEAAFMVGEIAI